MDAIEELVIDMNVFAPEPIGKLRLIDGTQHDILDALDVSNADQALLIKYELQLRNDGKEGTQLGGERRIAIMNSMIRILVPTVSQEQFDKEFTPRKSLKFVKALRNHVVMRTALEKAQAGELKQDPQPAASSQ